MSGADCYSNPPILNGSSGAGHVQNIGGLNAYVTGFHHSILAILLVSDVFGYKAPLLRKLADKVAATGPYFVVVPDFFNNDPFDPENARRPLSVWIKDHQPEKGFEAAKPVIEALKSKGASAIGAAGFCWGAKTVVDLGKTKHVQAAAILHPAYVTVDDIKRVKAPIAIVGAQNDTISPPKLIKQFEQVLSTKPEVDSYVTIFPKVSHGFTLRYDPNDPKAVKAAEKAHQIMLDWFDKHLKHSTKKHLK